MKRNLIAAALAGVLGAAGCASIDDSPDDSLDDSFDDPLDAETDVPPDQRAPRDLVPAPSCAAGELCAPPIPPGWSGPVTVVSDPAGEAACPGEMPIEVERTFRDVDVDDMSCGCSCGRPRNLTCDAPLALRTTDADCSDLTVFNPTKVLIPVGSATALSGVDKTWFRDPNDGPLPEVTGGECAPISDNSFPEPERIDPVLLCAADAGESCDGDGSCVPEMADSNAPMCIYMEADVECPPGPFTERSVTYRDIDDTRACSDCSCGAPTGSCAATVAFSTPGTFLFDVDDACIELPETPILANLVPDVECAAAPSTAFGDVEPAGAVTACCLP